jgi:hypothetical protein
MLVQARDVQGNWGPSSSGSFTTSNFYTDNLAFVGGSVQGNPSITGYVQASSIGALSPNTLSGGKTITAFYLNVFVDCSNPINCIITYSTYLNISGFSSDPGAGWLQQISWSGGSLTGPSAATFSCSSGTCTWYWPNPVGLSGSSTMTVLHP